MIRIGLIFVLSLNLVNFSKSTPLSLNKVDVGKFESNEVKGFYRLPDNTRPLSYDLWIKTDIDSTSNFKFEGKVNIIFDLIDENIQKVTLHARQLNILSIDFVNPSNFSHIRVPNLNSTYDEKTEFLIIDFASTVYAGTFAISISYSGFLRKDSHGFYLGEYRNELNETVYYAATQLESTDARHVMPCYDEPGLRAPITLQIEHPAKFNAISNSPVESRLPEGATSNQPVTTKFKPTPSMQTYLLAFLISDFDSVNNSANINKRIEQNVYAVPEAIKSGEANYSLSVVDDILKGLEDYLGVLYPLTKMDHAALTTFSAGGMENFGLITYIDNGLLLKAESSSDEAKQNVIELISHEYAHQFFGDVVSPEWWSYLWLSEGFATLMSTFIPSQIYPNDHYIMKFHLNAQANAFRSDDINAKPLNFDVESPKDIENKFDVISYSKGAAVLRMFQRAIGEKTFAKGLKNYLTDKSMKSATPQDLHTSLQNAIVEDDPSSEIHVGKFMQTWEDQNGFPTVTVEKQMGKFLLTQKSPNGTNFNYTIPITYVTKSQSNFTDSNPKLWMEDETVTIDNPSNDSWIVLNLYHDGYYKVKYSKEIFTAIVESLQENYNNFPIMNRVGFYEYFMSQRNDIDKFDDSIGLQLLKTSVNETDALVWSNGIVKLQNIFQKTFSGTALFENYRNFTLENLKSHITKLGYQAKSGESLNDANLRKWVISSSCQLMDKECMDFMFGKLKADVNSVEEGFECSSFRNIDNQTFSDLSLTELQYAKFLPYFTCSLNEIFFNNSLQIFLNKTIEMQKSSRILMMKNGLSTQEGIIKIMDVFAENLDAIYEILGSDIVDIFTEMSLTTSVEENFDRFSALLGQVEKTSYLTPDAIQSLTETAKDIFSWLKDNPEVYEFFGVVAPTEAPTTVNPNSTDTPTTVGPTTTLGAASTIASLLTITICILLSKLV